MTNPLIVSTARYFGVDADLIAAVMVAEGGTTAHLLKAVRCSLPNTKDDAEAVRITCRSALHALYDFYFKAGGGTPEQFVEYWARRWAPVGAANDPTSLNANWPKNVKRAWLGK